MSARTAEATDIPAEDAVADVSDPAPTATARQDDEDMPLPADAPKPPKTRETNLKGGIGGPSGGERFGLNW